MKSIILICGLSALFLMNCSSGGDKFVGNWTNTGNALVPKNHYAWQFNIQKVDNTNFNLRFLKYDRMDTVKIVYDKTNDILRGLVRSSVVRFTYLKDKDHLLMQPLDTNRKNVKVLEFERIKDK